MEIFEKLIPLITGVVTSMLAQPFINAITSFQRRRIKKLSDTNDLQQLIEKFDTDFKEKFVMSNLKENYFYMQTGILTNEDFIKKYINLKDKLGGNFTWEHIRAAREHLDLRKEEIMVKMNKFDNISGKIILLCSFLLFGISLFVVFRFGPEVNYFSKSDLTKFITLFLAPAILGYVCLSLINSFLASRAISKALKNRLRVASGENDGFHA